MPEQRTPIVAPHTSHDAAGQLETLANAMDDARTLAKQYANARDRAEHLYRREQAKARLQVDGRSADVRDAAVHEWPLDGDARVASAEVAEAMGMGADAASTVGELRWLRDRATSLAESWRDKAFDARESIKAWVMVAAMAKSETDLAAAPERRAA